MRIVAFILLLATVPANAAIDVRKCWREFRDMILLQQKGQLPNDAVAAVVDQANNPDVQRFFKRVLIPATGIRALLASPGQPRTATFDGNRLTISGFGPGRDLQVEWSDRFADPQVLGDNGHKVLVIPKGYDFKRLEDGGKSIVRQWLVGHPLHTYDPSQATKDQRVALGEDPLHLKDAQVEGSKAVAQAYADGDQTFLFIGPTAIGKTEVLKSALGYKLAEQIALDRQNSPDARHLSIVTAHENAIVDQLEDDVQAIIDTMKASGKYNDVDFEIVRWGGSDADSDVDLQELLARANQKGKQVILVSTNTSVVERFGNPLSRDPREIAKLDAVIRALNIYGLDEAHHGGAAGIQALIKALLDPSRGSRAVLYGTTATPTHHEIELIREVFNDRAFYANKDTAAGYRLGQGRAERSIADVLDQLETGIERGELNPFRPFSLDPEAFEADIARKAKVDEDTRLFIPASELKQQLTPEELDDDPEDGEDGDAGGPRVMNPAQYPNIIARLRPFFLRNQRGFLTVRSKKEAEDFTAALRTFFANDPDRTPRFEFLHSGLSDAEVERRKLDFKEGRIDFLVTIRMMDEGVNVGDLTMYMDLTDHTGARQRLQRIGRVIRLYTDKTRPSDVVMFQNIDSVTTAQMLLRLNAMGSRGGRRGGGGGGGTVLPVDTVELPPDSQWTEDQINQFMREFFVNGSTEGKNGANEAARLAMGLRQIGPKGLTDSHNWNGKTVTVRLGNSPSKQVSPRVIVNEFIARSESTAVNAAGNQAFEASLLLADPATRQWAEDFRAQLRRQKELMKTPRGLAELVKEELATHGKLMNSATAADVEAIAKIHPNNVVRFYEVLHEQRDNINFLVELDRLGLTDGQRRTVTESFLNGARERLADPVTVARWAESFLAIHHRMPNPAAKGFEGDFAKAVQQLNDAQILRHVNDRTLVPQIESYRNAGAATAGKAPAAYAPPKLLKKPSTRDKLRTRVDQQLAQWTAKGAKVVGSEPEVKELRGIKRLLEAYEVAEKSGNTQSQSDLATELNRVGSLDVLLSDRSGRTTSSKASHVLEVVGSDPSARKVAGLYEATALANGVTVKKTVDDSGATTKVVLELTGHPDKIDPFIGESKVSHSVRNGGLVTVNEPNAKDLPDVRPGMRTYRFETKTTVRQGTQDVLDLSRSAKNYLGYLRENGQATQVTEPFESKERRLRNLLKEEP